MIHPSTYTDQSLGDTQENNKHALAQQMQLHQEIEQTKRELQEARDALKRTEQQMIQHERLRALGEMASGIVHDLNNSLQPILGFSEMLLKFPDVLADDTRTKGYLEIISTAAQDAAKMVNRLRQFYRNRKEEPFEAVNLSKVVEQCVTFTQPKWQDEAMGRGLDIRLILDLEEVPPIQGNEAELREALTNLIFNAVDAMHENGSITLRLYSDGSEAALEITDTGMGMTDETLHRCFEPFYSTKHGQGSGLGLSMVYGIIERHEAKIAVSSKWGNGTTFALRFPVTTDARVTHNKPRRIGIRRSLNVLVAEDREPIRELVAMLLVNDGHHAQTAANGCEALQKFQTGQFDVVITDRAMPEMNGEKLVESIRQLSPDQPIIMMTGSSVPVETETPLPNGVDAVLHKPITLDSFRAALAKVS